MKKILCCLIACIVLSISVTPCSIFAESAAAPKPRELYFDFENAKEEWNLTGENNFLERVEGGVDGGYCASGKQIKSDFHIDIDTTYRVAGWIKVGELPQGAFVDSPTHFTLQWYHNGNTDAGVRGKDAKTLVKHVVDEWQYFEINFTYNRSFIRPTDTYVSFDTTVWLQIYGAATFTYKLDNYSISVVDKGSAVATSQDEKSTRLVKGGNFEDRYIAADWSANDTTVAPEFFGADNTMTALSLDMKANGTFGQNVATGNGDYVGTLYTKQAEDDTAVISILANGTPVDAGDIISEPVADGWTKHTFEYTAAGATVFSVTSSADSVFSIDEFSIEPKAAAAALYAKNIKANGKLLPGEQVTFNWEYSTAYSGRTIVKVSKYVNGAWTVAGYDVVGSNVTTYALPTLKDSDAGLKFKIEILPVDVASGTTVKCSYYETAAVKNEFYIDTDNFVAGSENVSATVEVTNFVEGKDILVTICLFNEKNAMIDCDYEYIDSTENSLRAATVSCAANAEAVSARVFVWGGTGIDSSDMTSIKAVSEFDLN